MSNQPDAPDAASSPSQGVFSWLCLSVGQIVSLLGCITTPLAVLVVIERQQRKAGAGIREEEPLGGAAGLRVPYLEIIAAGVLVFCYSAAMYIVFSHVKQSCGRRPAFMNSCIVRLLLVLLAVALFFMAASLL
jgi:hypothetical protein